MKEIYLHLLMMQLDLNLTGDIWMYMYVIQSSESIPAIQNRGKPRADRD